MPKPFRIEIPDSAIADLHARLGAWRRPAGVTDSGGLALSEVSELVRYWREDFDWRAQEKALNRWPHYRITLGGAPLHFIHLKCRRRPATPLLLLHGWPGSFVEMRHAIPLLADDFDLVIPSLPGYGFSELPHSGFSNARIAEIMAELMSKLGYSEFGIQGGDWGAGIGTWLARKHPSRVIGLHLNYIPGSYAPHVAGRPSGKEQAFIHDRDEWVAQSYGYGQIQRTRPLTLGYGLCDSPAGLAAWIHEKFVEWSDPETRPSLDDIVTNISIYWFTNSIASSMRLYMESALTPLLLHEGERVEVPAGILRCHLEAPFPPRSWIERGYDVRRWTDSPRGGHFAALEVPEVFAADVRGFFGSDLR
ncbi:MAG TPA: alpha/beta fold hydrolase [Thermoanaerobaculia bacterium]|nr:alpha/beta fold hydrolase [Thermoanaerobaculia bacterium]